jgi:hypothetical protein
MNERQRRCLRLGKKRFMTYDSIPQYTKVRVYGIKKSGRPRRCRIDFKTKLLRYFFR